MAASTSATATAHFIQAATASTPILKTLQHAMTETTPGTTSTTTLCTTQAAKVQWLRATTATASVQRQQLPRRTNSTTSTSNTFRAADISHKHEHSATHSPFYAARGRSNTRRANEGLESGLTEDGQGRDSPRRPSASLRDRVLPIGLTSVISKPTPGQVQGQGPNKTVRLRSKALYPYVSNWIYSNQKSARA